MELGIVKFYLRQRLARNEILLQMITDLIRLTTI